MQEAASKSKRQFDLMGHIRAAQQAGCQSLQAITTYQLLRCLPDRQPGFQLEVIEIKNPEELRQTIRGTLVVIDVFDYHLHRFYFSRWAILGR